MPLLHPQLLLHDASKYASSPTMQAKGLLSATEGHVVCNTINDLA